MVIAWAHRAQAHSADRDARKGVESNYFLGLLPRDTRERLTLAALVQRVKLVREAVNGRRLLVCAASVSSQTKKETSQIFEMQQFASQFT